MNSRQSNSVRRVAWLVAILAFSTSADLAAEPAPRGAPIAGKLSQGEVLTIWPSRAPGTEDWAGGERTETIKFPDGKSVALLTNITVPSLTIFPAKGHGNGTAVIIAPGGGFQILSWEMEGTALAKWLAARGVTAFVLKYRVRLNPVVGQPPGRTGNIEDYRRAMRPFEDFAIADGRQAIRLVRRDAARLGVSPDRIGMVGFSAGAVTTMGVVLSNDAADRPNFAAPIYGIMRDVPVPADAPPLFIAAAQNDGLVSVTNSVGIFSAWTAAKRPAELHVFQLGEHGFGMRKQGLPSDDWTIPFEAWLRSNGWLGSTAAHSHQQKDQ